MTVPQEPPKPSELVKTGAMGTISMWSYTPDQRVVDAALGQSRKPKPADSREAVCDAPAANQSARGGSALSRE